MRKKRETLGEYDDGSYVVKKTRKSSILAFIICVLISFVIWAYAEATEKDTSAVTNGSDSAVSETQSE